MMRSPLARSWTPLEPDRLRWKQGFHRKRESGSPFGWDLDSRFRQSLKRSRSWLPHRLGNPCRISGDAGIDGDRQIVRAARAEADHADHPVGAARLLGDERRPRIADTGLVP